MAGIAVAGVIPVGVVALDKAVPEPIAGIPGRYPRPARHHCQVARKGPRSVGTYGPFAVLRHPSRFFRTPVPGDGQPDVEAVRRGESRTVSCFLRAEFGSLPRRLRQGSLTLSPQQATWRPYWSLRRRPVPLGVTIDSIGARLPDHREPFVNRDGKAIGVLAVPGFIVLTCRTASGILDLVVPAVDQPLVEGYLKEKLS